MDAAVIPLPSEDVTPPVTKMYFAMAESTGLLRELAERAGCTREGIDLHPPGS
jgi:hypothetical protein